MSRWRRPKAVRDPYLGWHDSERLRMGRHSYGTPRLICYADDSGGVVDIGAFCSIAADVTFLVDGGHATDLVTTHPGHSLGVPAPPGHGAARGPTLVGHDVWIGRNATILSGVTIGTGAIIGACSVVARDVRPYGIVVGNPAQEVARRFSDDLCNRLLASGWWQWSDERLRAASVDLWSTDIERFLDRWT